MREEYKVSRYRYQGAHERRQENDPESSIQQSPGPSLQQGHRYQGREIVVRRGITVGHISSTLEVS